MYRNDVDVCRAGEGRDTIDLERKLGLSGDQNQGFKVPITAKYIRVWVKG